MARLGSQDAYQDGKTLEKSGERWGIAREERKRRIQGEGGQSQNDGLHGSIAKKRGKGQNSEAGQEAEKGEKQCRNTRNSSCSRLQQGDWVVRNKKHNEGKGG